MTGIHCTQAEHTCMNHKLEKRKRVKKISLLCVDFAKLMEKRLVNPPPEEGNVGASPSSSSADAGHPVLHVINIDNTISGVDEVMKKAMEDAREAMKEAKEDHKSAVRKAQPVESFRF